MKNEILAVLKNSRDYISGQQLCDKFRVSRTAVWKVMEQLKEEGYEIEAVRNRGYRLKSCPDVISESEILSVLQTEWAGRRTVCYKETDSTNNRARDAGEKDGVHGMLFAAERQSAGKGRRGRAWDSPGGSSIYMSILLRPDIRPAKAPMLTLVMGLSAAEGIKETTGVDAKIKWPNDIYWKDKKIAGILIENDLTGSQISQSIIGIGININQEEFHSSAPNPVSLRQITKKETDRMEVLNSVLEHIIDLYSRIENRETDIITKIQEYYLKAQYRKEGYHPYCDAKGEFTAKLIRVEPDGHLILKDKNGSLRKYAFKEVKYLL